MADATADDALITANYSQLMTEEELKEKAKAFRNKSFLAGIFPVLPEERSRIFLMCLIFCCIAFSYSFLRIHKDKVIYSVLEPSAQSWLKLFTFIVSLVVIGVIQRLLSVYSMDKVFEISLLGFSGLFVVNAVLLYFYEYVQFPRGWASEQFVAGASKCRGTDFFYMLALMFNQWVFTLYYILCEVIGTTMVSFLFMTYVNSHCTNDQNSRFVPILYIFSNISTLASSLLFKVWSNIAKTKDYEFSEKFFFYFPLGAVAIIMLIIVFKRRLDGIFAKPIVAPSGQAKKGKKKPVLSIIDGVYYAFTSKLLLSMCTMTLIYNISTNIFTSLFSNAVYALSPALGKNPSEYAPGLKSIDMFTTAGIVVLLLISPVSRLYQKFGIITPGLLPVVISLGGILGTGILAMINYPACGKDNMKIVSFFNDSPRYPQTEIYATLGMCIASKVSKYAFFDIVKEALSMKINPEIRPLFKAVFDGVCGKFGKFAGSFYSLGMEMILGERDSRYYAPCTVVLLSVCCIFWAWAIIYLHRSYNKAVKANSFMSPDYFEGAALKLE